jgi:hypothetical protein
MSQIFAVGTSATLALARRDPPPTHAGATALGLNPLDLGVGETASAGTGGLYRSSIDCGVVLGRCGRHRTNVWSYPAPLLDRTRGGAAGFSDHETHRHARGTPELTSPIAASLCSIPSAAPDPP